MKQKKRVQKAVLTALCCYITAMALLLGILRSTKQTRQILYGNDAVMAQCTANKTAAGMAYTMELGGGEWSFSVVQPTAGYSAQSAEKLPPCMIKLLLRLVSLAEYYTAECIQ